MQEWSRKELEEALSRNITSLFYLYTPMCGTCHTASKMLTVTAELLPDVLIGKADLNYMPDIAEQWEVESVPCLILLKEGRPVKKIYAFRSVPYLLDEVKRNLQS